MTPYDLETRFASYLFNVSVIIKKNGFTLFKDLLNIVLLEISPFFLTIN